MFGGNYNDNWTHEEKENYYKNLQAGIEKIKEDALANQAKINESDKLDK